MFALRAAIVWLFIVILAAECEVPGHQKSCKLYRTSSSWVASSCADPVGTAYFLLKSYPALATVSTRLVSLAVPVLDAVTASRTEVEPLVAFEHACSVQFDITVLQLP